MAALLLLEQRISGAWPDINAPSGPDMNPESPSLFYDARTVMPGMTGVGRYTYNLLAALAALPEGPRIRALFLKESIDRARGDAALGGVELIEAPVSRESHPRGDLWLERTLPRWMRPGEIYHNSAFLLPGGRQPFGRVVTIHDLFVFTHPRCFRLRFRAWLRWNIRRACRWADRIIVPSRTIADQLVELGLAPAEKVRPIHEAPDATPPIWEQDADETHDLPGVGEANKDAPLLLTVATLEPRKDPGTARRACIELKEKLAGGDASFHWIWVGGPGTVPDDSPEDLRLAARRTGFLEVGPRSRQTLNQAYNRATALVTCSRAEGFGIPLVEAMAHGCPIIASDIPIHREVAGDAALYFPLENSHALADQIKQLITDKELRQSLASKGLARSKAFSWRRAAEQTLAVYQECPRDQGGQA